MKKFRKSVAFLLVLLTTISVSACGAVGNDDIDESKTQLYVGILDGGLGEQYMRDVADAFEAEYKDYKGENGKVGVQVRIDKQKQSFRGETLINNVKSSRQDLYFTEEMYYYKWVSKGLMLDITDAVTTNLTEYGEEKSIADKMFAPDKDYLYYNDKYYAIPFYQGFIKTIREDENGKITIDYIIKNNSNFSLDVLWAGHCLINAENGGRVVVPFKKGAPIDLMFDKNGRFGVAGDRLLLEDVFLSTVWKENAFECRKFYFPEKCPEGYVKYEFRNKRTFLVEFDKSQISYLGVWLNYGYLNGYYCVGIEPCCLGYDNVVNAKEYGQTHKLKSKETFHFILSLSVYSGK